MLVRSGCLRVVGDGHVTVPRADLAHACEGFPAEQVQGSKARCPKRPPTTDRAARSRRATLPAHPKRSMRPVSTVMCLSAHAGINGLALPRSLIVGS